MTEEIILLYDKTFAPIKNSWKDSNYGEKEHQILDGFLNYLGFEKNKQTRYIAYERLAQLNSEPLKLYLETTWQKIKQNMQRNLKVEIPNKVFDKEKILEKAYDYTASLYEDYQQIFIKKLENVLDEFYLTIFKGVFNVGKAFNVFYKSRERQVKQQNKILEKLFLQTEEIINYLSRKKLFQVDETGKITERSYSVIRNWKVLSYAEAFPSEINLISLNLKEFIQELEKFLPKSQIWIDYLQAILDAFAEKDPAKTYKKWQKVDELWMKITDDIQISHPLEFYEDKYRKAVAPEWDLRIRLNLFQSKVEKNIWNLFETYKVKFSGYDKIFENVANNLSKVQLYISEPVLYFGSELEGLFSAQVVPNDEEISAKYWKKIFAFPRMVYQDKKNQPLTRLVKETFSEKILKNYNQILNNEKTFYEIYDVETIWHELGHILWIDTDTEILMNQTGQFKNVEEFKATTGGLVAYFFNDTNNETFNQQMMTLHTMRVVNLLKYQKVDDILPYYCEALIHLEIMVNSGFLLLDEKVDFDFGKYENLKQGYISNYEKLTKLYLEKQDASKFLFDYVIFEDWIYLPKTVRIKNFVQKFYQLYLEIGNEV